VSIGTGLTHKCAQADHADYANTLHLATLLVQAPSLPVLADISAALLCVLLVQFTLITVHHRAMSAPYTPPLLDNCNWYAAAVCVLGERSGLSHQKPSTAATGKMINRQGQQRKVLAFQCERPDGSPSTKAKP